MYITNLIRHFDQKLINEAVEYFRSKLPEEGCGVFTDNEFIPFENEAEDKLKHFYINDEYYYKLYMTDEVKCILHSHNDSPQLSYTDMAMQQSIGIPFGIVNFKDEKTTHVLFCGDLLEIEPLKKRPYFWGIFDCLTVVRDYYIIKYDIKLPNPPKEIGYWRSTPMFEDELAKSKHLHRIELNEADVGDIILYNFKSKYINHCGILLDNANVLHHFYNKISANYPIKFNRVSLHSVYRRNNK